MAWYIGLMSGTSLDGVDGVLAELDSEGRVHQSRAHVHAAFTPSLRAELLALNISGADELHRAAAVSLALAVSYAEVVASLLNAAGMHACDVSGIGAHGQTVRHQPRAFGAKGYTLQLMNGAELAERSGIDVICDFRSRDIAAGGEGAPLAPAFHASCFGMAGRDRSLLNLGGIANLTLLRRDGSVLGFDCGPANVLMDGWVRRHLGHDYDAGGAWAAGGKIDKALLQRCLAEPFFARPPPKSTGRDLFDLAWLDALASGAMVSDQDVMATLAELTVRGAVNALRKHAPATEALYVCGGGAANTHLMNRLGQELPDTAVQSTATLGVPPDQVEALAFAWLAQAFVARRPANLPAVTGARGPRLLGALYPAG